MTDSGYVQCGAGVMRGAMNPLKPGVSLHDYHVQVGELMTKELLDSA